MTTLELGSVGAVLSPDDGGAFIETAAALETMGFPTIWITGGPLSSLGQIADVVRATARVRVATGIIAVVRFPADDVAALYEELDATYPGRFVVGLGGAHAPNPRAVLREYLDRLDSVPRASIVLAALGPRMLDLANERAAGALPVLVTPDYTAQARARLGDEVILAVEQLVAVESDPARARAVARNRLEFLGRLPAYQANFQRMGFADDEITALGDRLIDALVPWGDATAIAAHVETQRRAGADHVAVSLVTDAAPDDSLAQWRELAAVLIQP